MCGLQILKLHWISGVKSVFQVHFTINPITVCFSGLEDIEEEREAKLAKRRKLHSVYDVYEEIGR